MRFPYKVVKNTALGTYGTKHWPISWYSLGAIESLFGAGSGYLKDFLEVPELNAVINLRARAMASGKQDAISNATGEQQAANQSLVRILRRPNWFQGTKEFWRQSSLWRDIYGNEYIYFLTPFGMPKSFKGMFTLNPAKVTIEYKPEGMYFSNATDEGVSYFYNTGTKKIPLDKESLIHLNDNRVQETNILTGTSKIKSLYAAIANIRAAYDKRNIALNMPIGILSNNSKSDAGMAAPMEPADKEEAMKALKAHSAVPVVTNLDLDYSNMTINASQLGLFEETREDTAKICDAYGVPYELLASQKGVTFTNLKEAKKQMYEETIIPDVDEKDGAINNHLMTEALSWEICTDFKHLPVFAEDVKQRAISFKQMVEGLSKAYADGAIKKEVYEAELTKFLGK